MTHLPTVFVVIVIAIIIPFLAWHLRRSRELVEKWAAANAYSITAIERRYLRAGPFFWRRGRGHEVFHVVVHDARGQQRSGYVRTGGWFLAQFSEQVAVSWDDGDPERQDGGRSLWQG
jgi:hypothetical protein